MTIFYRFETPEQFMAAVGTSEVEFSRDGVQYSVIGRIPDGGLDENDEPTFKAGWHVNASVEVDGWEAMRVHPAQPMRVFG